MLRKMLCPAGALMLLACTSVPARAQEPPADAAPDRVQVSGLFDVYYLYQFRNPPPGTLLAPGRVYYDIRHNQPTLALAELNVAKPAPPGGWGWTTTFIAGDVADLNHAGGPVSSTEIGGTDTPEGRFKNIQQVYLTYRTEGGYAIDAGKFYTPIGFEATEATSNMNYSHSYLYTILPSYHAGVRVTAPTFGHLTLAGYVVNALYNTARAGLHDDNGSKGVILQAAYARGPWVATDNLAWSRDKIDGEHNQGSVFNDFWMTWQAAPRTKAALNYDYRRDRPENGAAGATDHGIALYAMQTLTARQSVALRYSRLWARSEPVGEDASTLKPWEVTATYEVRLSPAFATRLEYRHDKANAPLYVDGDGAVTKGSEDTLLVAGLYTF